MPFITTFGGTYAFNLSYKDMAGVRRTARLVAQGNAATATLTIKITVGKSTFSVVVDSKLMVALLKTLLGLGYDTMRMSGNQGVNAP